MDPASHRIPTSHLAKLTSGRCLSVRYRLAPQNPFPSALLDGLIAYLSLLFPPPGSLHSAIPASKIIFAGDSAGGNLSLSLLLTLLTLHRAGVKSIRFHGADIPLPLPASLALNSPWCDISRALPSCHSNAKYDYLTPPPDFGIAENHPSDSVWPTNPPRVDLYVSATSLIHPLVSPVAAKAQTWKGAPPVYMCAGNEALEDEIAIVARRMHQAGVDITFDGYEGMPHCFAMIFPQQPMGRECMRTWAAFITDSVERNAEKGKATWAKALSDPVERVEVDFGELKRELGDEAVEGLLRDKRERYGKEEERLVRVWREQQQQAEQSREPEQGEAEDQDQSKPRL
jgi:acetyl esterase/lipase